MAYDEKLAGRIIDDQAATIERLGKALTELVEACAYVNPFVGVVATTPSVKAIRRAARFVEAVENAKAALKARK